jgi:hypothetical protein
MNADGEALSRVSVSDGGASLGRLPPVLLQRPPIGPVSPTEKVKREAQSQAAKGGRIRDFVGPGCDATRGNALTRARSQRAARLTATVTDTVPTVEAGVIRGD